MMSVVGVTTSVVSAQIAALDLAPASKGFGFVTIVCGQAAPALAANSWLSAQQ